jgi:hypothetical protein
MTAGQTESLVDGLPHRANRTIANNSQLSMYIQSGHEAVSRGTEAVDALICKSQAKNRSPTRVLLAAFP